MNNNTFFNRIAFGLLLVGCIMLILPSAKAQQSAYPFMNPSLTFDQRVNDFVARL